MRNTVERDRFVKDVGDQKAGMTEGRIIWGRGAGSILLALSALKGTEILRGLTAN